MSIYRVHIVPPRAPGEEDASITTFYVIADYGVQAARRALAVWRKKGGRRVAGTRVAAELSDVEGGVISFESNRTHAPFVDGILAGCSFCCEME